MKDLFGNPIAETKIVTTKKIVKNPVLPQTAEPQKKKERKKKEPKPKVIKEEIVEVTGGRIAVWLGIVKSKFLSGADWYVYTEGYHYFLRTEKEADMKVDELRKLGYVTIFKDYMPTKLATIKKSLDEHIEMFTRKKNYKIKSFNKIITE